MMDLFNSNYCYFTILAIACSYPLLQSFEKRIQFYKSWIYLLPAIFVMMSIHIPLDIIFTNIGVWRFNNELIYGISVFNLPIEEWLFFVIIPFSSLFIYKVLKYFFKIPPPLILHYKFALFAAIILFFLAILFFPMIYTSCYFIISGFSLLLVFYVKPKWWNNFLLMYFVSLMPFILINGLLTGSFTDQAVVIYNESHIIGFRVFNIPIEDFVYSFEILLTVIWTFEYFKSSQKSYS